MSKREWGLLCPEGHGLLMKRDEWTAKGVAWCPNDEHGGNGRFWRLTEAEEGWFDPTQPIAPSEAYLARLARAEAQRIEREQVAEEHRIADARRHRMATTPKERAAKVKTPQNCLCGCGGQTKGGRFIPGHDARYHARIRILEGQFGLDHDEAAKIASKGPLTGKYAVKPKAQAEAKPKVAAVPKPTPARKRAKAPDLTARADDQPDTEAQAESEPDADIEV